jgi:hypothetical protein
MSDASTRWDWMRVMRGVRQRQCRHCANREYAAGILAGEDRGAVCGARLCARIGERLVAIDYLPRGAATLKPQTAFAKEVCNSSRRISGEPKFEFTLPFVYEGTDFQIKVLETPFARFRAGVRSYLQ